MSTAASVPVHILKLSGRREVAERTIAFEFDKPVGFAFKAGQFAEIAWMDPQETDAEGNSRAFSIASAPHEERLMFTTRLRDTAFKRELPKMALGTEVQIEGPGGSLALHNNPARAAVFLAGGIGVTPIRSILVHAAQEKLPHRIVVFFCNRRPEDAAFLDELTRLQEQNPRYSLVATMTQMDKSSRPWTGERGQITEALLKKYLGGVPSPIYYVVGPPGMVNGLHAVLNQIGIDDDDIRTEDFGGY